MIEHAGLGSLFSALIVVAFTLILREVERTVPEPPQSAPTVAPTRSSPPPLRKERPARPISEPSRRAVHRPAGPATSAAAANPLADAIGAPRPVPGPGATLVSTAAPRRAEVRPVGPLPAASAASPAVPDQTAGRRQIPPSRPPEPTRPRSSVTTIELGEQLRDVAVRVYGSAAATTQLWRANRDRLPQVDSPVSAGWLLRTP